MFNCYVTSTSHPVVCSSTEHHQQRHRGQAQRHHRHACQPHARPAAQQQHPHRLSHSIHPDGSSYFSSAIFSTYILFRSTIMFSPTLSVSLLQPETTTIDDLLFSWRWGLSREEFSEDKAKEASEEEEAAIACDQRWQSSAFEATDPGKRINEEWICHAHVAYLIAFPCRVLVVCDGVVHACVYYLSCRKTWILEFLYFQDSKIVSTRRRLCLAVAHAA